MASAPTSLWQRRVGVRLARLGPSAHGRRDAKERLGPGDRREPRCRASGTWRQHRFEASWGHWCHDLKMANGSLFEDVSDALRGLSPADLGELHCTHHRYGIKVWLGPATRAPREHYEAQVIGPQYAPEAATLAIEVGFHSETSAGGGQRGSHRRAGWVGTVVA
jgi:hypothetical protein